MKNNSNIAYSFFLIIGDFLALISAFVSAYILRVSLDDKPFLAISSGDYLKAFLILLPFWLLIFSVIGLYSKRIFDNRFAEFGKLLVGSFLGILFVISYSYITNTPIFPARIVTVYGLGLSLLYVLLFRTIARVFRRWLFSYGYGVNNVLIVGNTAVTFELIRSLANTKITGYRVIGVVSSEKRNLTKNFKELPVYASFDRAVKAYKKEQIHSVIQTELYTDAKDNDLILTYCQQNHIAYRFVPGNSELFVGNIDVDLFQSFPLISVSQTPLIGWGRFVKRLFDLFVSIPLFFVFLPFIVLIWLALFIFDHGDPIFSQKRLGRYGKTFRIYKFRTNKHAYNRMTPEQGFEKMGKPELAKKYRANGDFLENDPRIGRIGKFLRATSLDELPQILNAIKGDISLVGPRPLEPFEMEQYKDKNLILSVKTGLTGLAVISGRRDISFEERRKLDLYYVQNWSFWSDITILLKTAVVVIFHKGAR